MSIEKIKSNLSTLNKENLKAEISKILDNPFYYDLSIDDLNFLLDDHESILMEIAKEHFGQFFDFDHSTKKEVRKKFTDWIFETDKTEFKKESPKKKNSDHPDTTAINEIMRGDNFGWSSSDYNDFMKRINET